MPALRPLPSRRAFLFHLLRGLAVAGGIVGVSLAIGASGYHWLGGLGWLDATLNAAMILTGMGPVSPLATPPAKVFGIAYALYSGVAFLTVVAVLFAPAVHRLLHRFHLDVYGED